MKYKTITIFILVFFQFFLLAFSNNNKRFQIREADFELAAKFTEKKLKTMVKDSSVYPNWIPGATKFWYSFQTTSERKFILIDYKNKSVKPLFNRKALALCLRKITKKPIDHLNIPITNITTTDSCEIISFKFEDQKFKYYIPDNKLSKIDPGKKPEDKSFLSISPDKKIGIYSKNYELHIKNLNRGGDDITLTDDCQLYYNFNLTDYDLVNAAKKDPSRPSKSDIIWSPDSQKFLTIRTDTRHLNSMYVFNSITRPRPELIEYKVSLPDEDPRKYEVWIYNHNLKRMIRVGSEKWEYQEYGDFVWSKNSARLYMIRKSKDQLKCDLISVDPYTGKSRVLIEERNAGMILTQPVKELNSGKELIWFSRRSGLRNYYLYGINGKLKYPITKKKLMLITY